MPVDMITGLPVRAMYSTSGRSTNSNDATLYAQADRLLVLLIVIGGQLRNHIGRVARANLAAGNLHGNTSARLADKKRMSERLLRSASRDDRDCLALSAVATRKAVN